MSAQTKLRILQYLVTFILLVLFFNSCTPATPRMRTDPIWSALLINQLIDMGRPPIQTQPIGVVRCMPDGIGGTTCYSF